MFKIRKRIFISLGAALLMDALSGCSFSAPNTSEDVAVGDNDSAALTETQSDSDTANSRMPATLELTDATVITLSDSGISIEGSGAEADGSVITITDGGVYAVSGTLSDGRIIVNADNEDVTVALNGASITCSYGSPLYLYSAATATVHLMEGTENLLADGASYTFADSLSSSADEEPNACLYSKDDLVIEGAGSLTVEGNYNNGITSKDTLQIYDGKISVTAVNHGINGKDSNTMDSVSLTVVCGGDAIRSTEDTDDTLGGVCVSNSTLVLDAGEDGIQAETSVSISRGSYTITSGGGSGVQPSDEISAKGIKAGTTLTLASGTYTMDCSDDAFHSNGNVAVNGGIYTISTGDDAFHADEQLAVSDGEIQILTSYEGLEGSTVSVSGGTISIVSTDDGVNAAGGTDGSGTKGFGPMDDFGEESSSYHIEISGGQLVITAGGDGIDSNGSLTVSGGNTLVSSTGRGDGAIDYTSSFAMDGGTFLAFDTGAMSVSPSEASQYTIFVEFGTSLAKDTYVSLESESKSFVFQLPMEAATMLFSSPDLEEGATYTVSYGGEYTGVTENGICSDGVYSGGTTLTELTLSEYITTYGNVGMGGGRGEPGGGQMDRPRNMEDAPKGAEQGKPPVGKDITLPDGKAAPEASDKGTTPGGGGPDGGGPDGGHGGIDESGGKTGEADPKTDPLNGEDSIAEE